MSFVLVVCLVYIVVYCCLCILVPILYDLHPCEQILDNLVPPENRFLRRRRSVHVVQLGVAWFGPGGSLQQNKDLLQRVTKKLSLYKGGTYLDSLFEFLDKGFDGLSDGVEHRDLLLQAALLLRRARH